MALNLVISGGQDGADIAGLRAAKAVGLSTGGIMPYGFRTLHGPLESDVVAEFGLQEHESYAYPPRTRANVNASDGTIRLAYDFDSAGERCTLGFIKELGRPYLDIPIQGYGHGLYHIEEEPAHAAMWIIANEIDVLNVAGNGNTSIEPCVEHFLMRVFKLAAA